MNEFYTGCLLKLCFIEDFPGCGFSLFPLVVSVCVYTIAGQTPAAAALQQNLQSSEKSQQFKEIHNIS